MNTKKSTDELRFGAFSDHDAQVDVNKRKNVERISLTSYTDGAITHNVKRKPIGREAVIKMLRDRQGKLSINKFAASLGISQPHLSDIYNGKRDPGPKVLSRLGLTQTVKYERTA